MYVACTSQELCAGRRLFGPPSHMLSVELSADAAELCWFRRSKCESEMCLMQQSDHRLLRARIQGEHYYGHHLWQLLCRSICTRTEVHLLLHSIMGSEDERPTSPREPRFAHPIDDCGSDEERQPVCIYVVWYCEPELPRFIK